MVAGLFEQFKCRFLQAPFGKPEFQHMLIVIHFLLVHNESFILEL